LVELHLENAYITECDLQIKYKGHQFPDNTNHSNRKRKRNPKIRIEAQNPSRAKAILSKIATLKV
jgi:hypothetical protein